MVRDIRENRGNEFSRGPLHIRVVRNGPTNGHITGAPCFNATGDELAGIDQEAGADLLKAMVPQSRTFTESARSAAISGSTPLSCAMMRHARMAG